MGDHVQTVSSWYRLDAHVADITEVKVSEHTDTHVWVRHDPVWVGDAVKFKKTPRQDDRHTFYATFTDAATALRVRLRTQAEQLLSMRRRVLERLHVVNKNARRVLRPYLKPVPQPIPDNIEV